MSTDLAYREGMVPGDVNPMLLRFTAKLFAMRREGRTLADGNATSNQLKQVLKGLENQGFERRAIFSGPLRDYLKVGDEALANASDGEALITLVNHLTAGTPYGTHWAYNWIQAFLQATGSESRTATSFAAVVNGAHGRGEVVKLELTLTPGKPSWKTLGSAGALSLQRHPGDVVGRNHDTNPEVRASMEDALALAEGIASDRRKVVAPGVVFWRFLDTSLEPIKEVEGKSAGGAAFHGIAMLLGLTRFDCSKLVLAKVTRANLEPFSAQDHLTEKASAAARVHEVRAIVVASESNARSVHSAISELRAEDTSVQHKKIYYLT